MKIAHVLACTFAFAVVGTVACSSDDSNGSTGGTSSAATSCGSAKQVADECNAKPADGGAKTTITFKQDECEKAGDQGKKVADCIVANKSNCDCFLSCSLKGSCP